MLRETRHSQAMKPCMTEIYLHFRHRQAMMSMMATVTIVSYQRVFVAEAMSEVQSTAARAQLHAVGTSRRLRALSLLSPRRPPSLWLVLHLCCCCYQAE